MRFYACVLMSLVFQIPILVSRSSFQFDEILSTHVPVFQILILISQSLFQFDYACLLMSLFFQIPILISRSSFQFDEMVVDGAVEMQIYQNRNFYSEAVQELSVPVAFQLCCAVVSIEQIVA